MSHGQEMLIRTMLPGDLPWVINSWLENARKSYHVKGIPNDIYYSWAHRILEDILPRATTYIACDPEDMDTNYGWACVEVIDNQLVFHYIYVKGAFKAQKVAGGKRKGWGVGTALVREAVKFDPHVQGVTYTHETMAGRAFLRTLWDRDVLPKEPVYNPYLLYSSLQPGWGET